MRKLVPYVLIGLALLAVPAYAQFASTGTTTLSVSVGAEAAIQIDTATTTLSTSGTTFNNPYTGLTNFTYKVRTTKTGGSGSVTLQVTADFAGSGPKVASPPSPGDALTYTCTVSTYGCSSAQTATTTGGTNVATFGANVRSTKSGDSGSVSWSLTNDPVYETGNYTATVTFTISAA
jgi:hypothetical protein